MRWSDALAGMGPERLVRRAYEAEMGGNRERGRPGKGGVIVLKQ